MSKTLPIKLNYHISIAYTLPTCNIVSDPKPIIFCYIIIIEYLAYSAVFHHARALSTDREGKSNLC